MMTARLELPTYRTAFVGSQNLTPEDVAVLNELSVMRNPMIVVRRDVDGFDVSTDLDDDADGSKDAALAERMSETFMSIYRDAIDQGCAFVRFDASGS